MAAIAVVVDTLRVKAVADRIGSIDAELIGKASVTAVNEVAQRTFELSRKRMTERVNLTEQYVRERMDIEPANDSRNPTATIIAFRSGGRRAAIRPVNLRQYKPLYELKTAQANPDGPVFKMRDGRLATNNGGGANPRAAGKRLPFVLRTGNSLLGIPTGQKPGNLSVEVLKGQRKVVKPVGGFGAFLQKMPEKNGGQILVMRRTNTRGGQKGKGSIEPLYSLSVWQLFRRTVGEVIPLVQDDLEDTVGKAVVAQLERAIG